ncbi:hypothetical protein ABIF74_009000 [Bradyrhizobium japonicum]
MASRREARALAGPFSILSSLLSFFGGSSRAEFAALLSSVLPAFLFAIPLFALTIALDTERTITAQAVKVFCFVILIRVSFTITRSFDFKKATHDLSYSLEQKNAVLERSLVETAPDRSLELAELGFDQKVLTHLRVVVDQTATIIGRFVGKRCAVSIKVLCSPPEGAETEAPHVYTLLRDEGSSDRGQLPNVPDKFPYIENSAFRYLLEQRAPIFSSNNLDALSAKGEYDNSNPLWKNYYNQAVVVPIGVRDGATGRYTSMIGFLCIDALTSRGNLATPIVRQEVTKIADHVYTTFRILHALYEGRSTPSSNVGWISSEHPVALAQEQIQHMIESVLGRMIEIDTSKTFNDQPTAWVAGGYPGAGPCVAERSLREGQVMKQPEQAETARQLMREAQAGFTEVLEHTPSVLLDFENAFKHRARISELPEASGTSNGLERVLSSLLRVSPPPEMIEAYRHVESAPMKSAEPSEQLVEFKAKISAALIGLSLDNPITLRRFYRNLGSDRMSSKQAVGALLLLYVRNRDSYPF